LGIEYNSGATVLQLYARDNGTGGLVLDEFVGYGSAGRLSPGNFAVVAEGTTNNPAQTPNYE
jgi:hypothetical protein